LLKVHVNLFYFVLETSTFLNVYLRLCLREIKGQEAGEKWHCSIIHTAHQILVMMRSWGMNWAGHVENMGEIRSRYKIWLESLKKRD
jgi:hypothetical protein